MELKFRYSLLIEYEGTGYAGWQIQDNQKTIQSEIENALGIIQRKKIRIIGAGRTDTGVHARGQVAHFDLEIETDPKKIQRSLNGLLPKDIRIKNCKRESIDFHARFSAIERKYCYYIARKPSALLRHCSWFINAELEFDNMQKAANLIHGKHNFQSFCRANSEVKHYFCIVNKATWINSRELLIFDIRADRYLHGMVRALVGTFVNIGLGKLTIEDFQNIIATKDRTKASQAAPAKGLVLEQVFY